MSDNDNNTHTNSSSLANQVKLNLIHYNLWTDVKIYETLSSSSSSGIVSPILSGISPTTKETEWVVCKSLDKSDAQLSTQEIESWFVQIEKINVKWHAYQRPKKIIIAIVNDDSTVVYYNIHDGLVKPRQN
ncbi:tRNA-splicing endonuclease subunit Sen15 [Scheffersomyces amazonensis]|uniref:tRNA-splicing endonuclease subunit Sen15 n=1 Tax=Scheffersomyces amazonensis TaxID=1078765 RepID=UPI00315DBE33